eukprot:Colp12_sorted_trinity150504_noHs@30384
MSRVRIECPPKPAEVAFDLEEQSSKGSFSNLTADPFEEVSDDEAARLERIRLSGEDGGGDEEPSQEDWEFADSFRQRYSFKEKHYPPMNEHMFYLKLAEGDNQMCYVCLKKSGFNSKNRMQCAVCRISVHSKCMDAFKTQLEIKCRPCYVVEKSNKPFEHHWVYGVWPGSRCDVCKKACGPHKDNKRDKDHREKDREKDKDCKACLDPAYREQKLTSRRCSWCKETVHRHCRPRETCELGRLKKLLLPAACIARAAPMSPVVSTERLDTQEESTEDGIPAGRDSEDFGSDATTSAPRRPRRRRKTGMPMFHMDMPEGSTPLLVFINPKSGGNQGVKLLKKFLWLLNPLQVFDLSNGGPMDGLRQFSRLPNLRILVCGGDGTAGWIMSSLDKLYGLADPQPPIAILPLGTGND